MASYKEKADKYYNLAVKYCNFEGDFLTNQDKPENITANKLGVFLNYGIFLYHIKQERKEALRLVSKKLREALDSFDRWNQDEFEDIKH